MIGIYENMAAMFTLVRKYHPEQDERDVKKKQEE
jgi:hypothetical protein